ncbi:hypothetical protein L3Y34_011482 [Caenorhabditis briggsae]|uniref:Uncharacterized protein n=1 Tax=Caenorhabditis briggsae TaxID=6238 RepID=A0AAE9CUH4_CAEBR|nr:hypothetical protein L3Y34_011482 [Caenorhabditis briggsae]
MLGEFLANWMIFIFKPANIPPFRELFDRENNQDRLKNITEFSIIEQHVICLICSGKAVEDGNHRGYLIFLFKSSINVYSLDTWFSPEKSIYRVHKPSANNRQRQGTSLQGAESDVSLTTAKAGQRASSTCKQGTSLQGTMITRNRRNQNFLREKKYISKLKSTYFQETRSTIAAPSGLRQGTGTKVGNPVEVNSEKDSGINERRSNLRTNHEVALLQCVTWKKRKAPSAVIAACPDETFLSLSLKMRKELLQFLLNSKRPGLWESCRGLGVTSVRVAYTQKSSAYDSSDFEHQHIRSQISQYCDMIMELQLT